MQLILSSRGSANFAGIRKHRAVAPVSAAVKVESIQASTSSITVPRRSLTVDKQLAISVDSLGFGFGVAGSRKQVSLG